MKPGFRSAIRAFREIPFGKSRIPIGSSAGPEERISDSIALFLFAGLPRVSIWGESGISICISPDFRGEVRFPRPYPALPDPLAARRDRRKENGRPSVPRTRRSAGERRGGKAPGRPRHGVRFGKTDFRTTPRRKTPRSGRRTTTDGSKNTGFDVFTASFRQE